MKMDGHKADVNASSEELDVDEVMDESEPYVLYDIVSYPSDLTLSGIHEMWENGSIVIPDYQRNYVWNIKQASLLIESFLMGLPVPQVFFYVENDNRNEVIDGQQRITSVVYYLSGYFGSETAQGKRQVFRLKGLNEKSPFLDKSFEDLDERYQRKLKGATLRAINIRQMSPQGQATSVYHIFERLNTGGTPLKPQEIRNCVFRGEFVNILRELNDDPNWRRILGKKASDKHQKDVELILRIFALSAYFGRYEKPMKEFLNIVMEQEKKGFSDVVKQFQQKFVGVSRLIVTALGDMPFHVRGPLNTAVLDSVYHALLASKTDDVVGLSEKFVALNADAAFVEATSISTSDAVVIKRRFAAARRYLLGE